MWSSRTLPDCVSSFSTFSRPSSPPQAMQPWSLFHDTHFRWMLFGIAICTDPQPGQTLLLTTNSLIRALKTYLLAEVDEHGDRKRKYSRSIVRFKEEKRHESVCQKKAQSVSLAFLAQPVHHVNKTTKLSNKSRGFNIYVHMFILNLTLKEHRHLTFCYFSCQTVACGVLWLSCGLQQQP